MSNLSAPPRILYLGMAGAYSHTVLKEILNRRITVQACIVPVSKPAAGERELPVLNEQPWSIETLAADSSIPCYSIAGFDEAVTARIRSLNPDIILVACFSLKIPQAVIDLAGIGCYNLHPSLLPEYRGPVPLFWQFRRGAGFGVTLHAVVEQLDAGDIVYQKPVTLADACSGEEANRVIATAGAELIQNLLMRLDQGSVAANSQDEHRASYQGWPTRKDFSIPLSWTARRAFNFIKGTRHWNQHYTIETGRETISTRNAVMYSDDKPVNEQPSLQYIPFRQGYLVIKSP